MRDEIEEIQHDYKKIAKEVPGFKEKYDFIDFMKAKMLVTSRNFGLKINGL